MKIRSVKETEKRNGVAAVYKGTPSSPSAFRREGTSDCQEIRFSFRTVVNKNVVSCYYHDTPFLVLLGVLFILFAHDGQHHTLVAAASASIPPTLSTIEGSENMRANKTRIVPDLKHKERKRKTKKRRGRQDCTEQEEDKGIIFLNNQSYSHRPTLSQLIAEANDSFESASNMSTNATTQHPVQEKRIAKYSKILKTTPWIEHFVSTHGEDALLRIPRDFLQDNFNLYNLPQLVEEALKALVDEHDASEESDYDILYTSTRQTNKTFTSNYFSTIYRAALKKILDTESEPCGNGIVKIADDSPQRTKLIEKAAEIIYFYAHSRFVSSQRGLDIVHKMLMNGEPIFGRCPRRTCQGMRLLPYGKSDIFCSKCERCSEETFLSSTAMRYCCCCGEVFVLKWRKKNEEGAVDGCAWGPSFCHLYLMTHGKDFDPRLLPTAPRSDTFNRSNPMDEYIWHLCDNQRGENTRPTPTIFGFKLHPSAPIQYPILIQRNQQTGYQKGDHDI